MSIVQKVTANLKGESEEIEVYSNHARQKYKVAPFTNDQEARFYELAKFTESYEFRAAWKTNSTNDRALEIGEKYPDWVEKVVYFLREVTNIGNYTHAIELLNALRIKRHDIYVKHELAAFKKYAAIRAKAQNAVNKKRLLEEKQNVLDEITRYEQEISEAQARLDAWKPLEFTFEPIYLKGRAYQVTSFDTDAQSQYVSIRTSSHSIEEQIQGFAERVFTPAPRSEGDAIHLFNYFEEMNPDVFSDAFSNSKVFFTAQNAVLQKKSFIDKAQEHLASINEQLERIAELEASQS